MHVVDLSLGTNKERKENRRKAQQRSAGGGPGRGCTHPPPRTLAHSRTPSHTRTLAHSHTRLHSRTHALTRTLAHSHTRLRSAVLWLSHMERRRRTNACMYSPTAKARTILNLTTFAWAAPVSPSFHLSLYRPCSLCFPRMRSDGDTQ